MTTTDESMSTTYARSGSTSCGISISRPGGYTGDIIEEDHDAQEHELRLLRMKVKYQRARIAELELQQLVQRLRTRLAQLERHVRQQAHSTAIDRPLPR